MFRIDRKALLSGPGLAMAGMAIILGALLLTWGECSRRPRYIAREEVWEVVKAEAAKHDLEARFIFAVIAAESSFNAYARNGDARGLMQIRPAAWKEVEETSHSHAWRWRENIAAGTAYLGFLKEFLQANDRFSYPLLAACYRHGPYRVEEVGFQLAELPEPRNEIYRAVYDGDPAPVPLPD